MTSGYSAKVLADKLGLFAKLKKGPVTFFVLNEPVNYRSILGALPDGIEINKNRDSYDLLHFFTQDSKELDANFEMLKNLTKKDGFLWISWPKGKSKFQTDLNENIIREIGLQNGMVDVKVIAVDDDWSGLKFVFRLKDR